MDGDSEKRIDIDEVALDQALTQALAAIEGTRTPVHQLEDVDDELFYE
jgi:hypothetical protein